MYNDDYELYHYGVKGMKWGHRKKYYNSDGSLNKLGQARQNYKTAKKEYNRSFDKAYNKAVAAYSPFKKHRQANTARWEDVANKAEASRNAKAEYKQAKKEYKESHPMTDRQKTALKVGAAAAGTALAAYGAYKAHQFIREKNTLIHIERGRKQVDDFLSRTRKATGELTKGGAPKSRDWTLSEIIDKHTAEAMKRRQYAREDSFGTAVKNVYGYYRKRR